MVLCLFPARFTRLLNEFVPYATRHNLNVQIPWSITFFSVRKAPTLWISLPVVIKSSVSHSIFINRLNSYYHLSKIETITC